MGYETGSRKPDWYRVPESVLDVVAYGGGDRGQGVGCDGPAVSTNHLTLPDIQAPETGARLPCGLGQLRES
jgi:hypothetical protein